MNLKKLTSSVCAGALALAFVGLQTPAFAQGAGGSGAPSSTEQPTTHPKTGRAATNPQPAPMPETTGQATQQRPGTPASEAGGGGGATGQGSGSVRQPDSDPRADPDTPVRR